uniref:P15 n=1 Tax=Xylella fastidiosa TaxID=2371 RepID=D5LLB2_XYLFS|nr:P15 [Xylella fastidiosa]ADF29435.1 P15 [Xylella fastidiosa]ADF29465.1 P15 [Xylella fastidiosa]ADF29495.1 P15 [Xylella fastidiosa]
MAYLLYPLRSKQSWSVVAVDMGLVGQHSCKNSVFATASDALIPLGSFWYFALSVAAKSNIALAASISCKYSEVDGTFSRLQALMSNTAQTINNRNV